MSLAARSTEQGDTPCVDGSGRIPAVPPPGSARTLWSYRAAFFSDWVSILVQVLVFYFLSRIIPSDRLPEYGAVPPRTSST